MSHSVVTKAGSHLVSGVFKDQVSLAWAYAVWGSLRLGWKMKGWAEAEGSSAEFGGIQARDPFRSHSTLGVSTTITPMTFLVRHMEALTGQEPPMPQYSVSGM